MTVLASPRTRPVRRDVWAITVVFCVAVAYRAYEIFTTYPALGGDESIIGQMAIHLGQGLGHPAFFYGQHYMGSLEAYLAAPLVLLLGPTVPALRLGTLLLYAGFFWGTYWTARQLVRSPWFAVLVCGLIALGSDRVLRQELVTNGGWEELLAFGALLTALTLRLAKDPGARTDQRLLGFGAWGLLAGLALWSSALLLPQLALLALLVILFQGRHVIRWPGLALLTAFWVGLSPAIVHNLRVPWPQGTIHNVLAYNPPSPPGVTFTDHLRGTLDAVALATGMCRYQCQEGVGRAWSLVFFALLAASLAGASVALFRTRGSRIPAVGVLAIGLGAVGTLALYAQSIHSAEGPALTSPIWDNARYLNNLLLAAPAILLPLWRLASRERGRVFAVIALVAIFGLATNATEATLGPHARLPETQLWQAHTRLLAELLERKITRLYADYFTCQKLIYASQERIICASLEPGLHRGIDRYPPYRAEVAAARGPAYVLFTDSEMDKDFKALLARLCIGADIQRVDRYTIYQPRTPVPVPR